MITKIEQPYEQLHLKAILHPLVNKWFFSKFKEFSLPQLYGVMEIHQRKNVLISAPTGATKTLTGFLAILNELIDSADKQLLEDKVYAIYVSPLKALNYDIQFNLLKPLEEIEEIAGKKLGIRVGVRTGDTTASEKARMLKHTPHILITTPESLAIMLTTIKFQEKMKSVQWLIIDEIHALADNKRGVHLNLSVERLQRISPGFTRVGLSATIAPLEDIAKYLVGYAGEEERNCGIVDVQFIKNMDLQVLSPVRSLVDDDYMLKHRKMYDLIHKLIQEHKTTVIFTNTRSATERVVHTLKEMFPKEYNVENIAAHHGSLSKENRFKTEQELRDGKLKVVVSSTSLELGIDIGYIDLVILLGSPKSVARALQRIGRAGHKLHSNPRGEFIVLDRDDLLECGILMKEMIEGKIDKAEIPKNCLDVLAQQIFGMAISRIWDIDEMLSTIRKSYCYESLSKEDFLDIISYLAGEYALEHRNVYAKIWYDSGTKQIGKRGKLARVIYMTNIGTIPEEGFISVVIQNPVEQRGQIIGKIDESFLERMKKGDIFVLGGAKYQYLYSRGMKIYVSAGVTRNPTIPSWFSEQLPLSFDVAIEINRFRKLIKELLKKEKDAVDFIQEYMHCKKHIAQEIYDYFLEQDKFAAVPDEKTIVVEKFKEEKEYLIFHTLYGRRVNDALSRAYAFAAARLKYRDVEIGVNDNGFFISGMDLDEKKIISYVTSKNLREILKEAIERTEVLARRFRHCAARSLMILRNYKGREKSVGKQQVHSGFLLLAVKKISNEFPILREARREVFEDLMDIKNAEQVLRWIESEKIKIKHIRTPFVSPFGLNLMLQGRSDLIKMEDRSSFLKRMHELHLKAIGSK